MARNRKRAKAEQRDRNAKLRDDKYREALGLDPSDALPDRLGYSPSGVTGSAEAKTSIGEARARRKRARREMDLAASRKRMTTNSSGSVFSFPAGLPSLGKRR